MATATFSFDAKRAGRLSLGRQKPAPAPPAVVEEVAVEQPPLTVAERMAKANPAFTQLVDTLNLEEVYHRVLPPDPPQPLPPLPPRVFVTTSHTEKLRTLAAQTYRPNTSYPPGEALQLLAASTSCSLDRASTGLVMMFEQGVLSLTQAGEYYLTDSTPF